MSDASSPDRDAALLGLAERLGHDFGDRFGSNSLLELALRHRSWCAEHGGVGSNERLEFLGDSVLGVVVTEYLYTTMPDAPEGVLARCRSEIVNWRSLAEVARDLEIGPVLRLGRGEIATGGAEKPSILADAVEAVVGAVFLDAGIDVARRVVLRAVDSHLQRVASGDLTDFKSRLQEVAAAEGLGVPGYTVTDVGPEHLKHFTAAVTLGTEVLGTGDGRSKKEAEQAAAQVAFRLIGGESSARSSEADVPPGTNGIGAPHG